MRSTFDFVIRVLNRRWVHTVLALLSGLVVLDHSLTAEMVYLAVEDERGYQERAGSYHGGWSNTSRTTTINANVLRLSDGTVLQLSSLGDFIAPGDTLEVRRTLLLEAPLEYRKLGSREQRWSSVDSNKLDYRIYPYFVFAFSFLLLFPWRSDYFRWSLQVGSILMTFCWLIALIGTGGIGRVVGLFM